jgi:hypothetical protein
MLTVDPEKWLKLAIDAMQDIQEPDREKAIQAVTALSKVRELPVTELSSSPLLRGAIVGLLYRRHLTVDYYDKQTGVQKIRKI